MNKFARMVDVLDLFSEEVTFMTAAEIADRLQVSRPTAFRYARELTLAGFLANYSGSYSLGARIITLDYRIRESDPVLKAARPVMRRLSAETAFSCILCRMYNEDVISVHREHGYDDVSVSFERGRPLPLFRGAPSMVMLASLPTKKMKSIYDRHAHDKDLLAIAPTWQKFREHLKLISERGYYISRGEMEADKMGVAAPIVIPDVGTVGVISVVIPTARAATINAEGLAQTLNDKAREVSELLNVLGTAAQREPARSA